jgi:hypothetical protein
MTPREKALQLCQKFGYLGIKWEQAQYTTLSLENAKECALITCNEVLGYMGADRGYEFWTKVKQEIEKL